MDTCMYPWPVIGFIWCNVLGKAFIFLTLFINPETIPLDIDIEFKMHECHYLSLTEYSESWQDKLSFVE